jgi:hypothetical protein
MHQKPDQLWTGLFLQPNQGGFIRLFVDLGPRIATLLIHFSPEAENLFYTKRIRVTGRRAAVAEAKPISLLNID